MSKCVCGKRVEAFVITMACGGDADRSLLDDVEGMVFPIMSVDELMGKLKAVFSKLGCDELDFGVQSISDFQEAFNDTDDDTDYVTVGDNWFGYVYCIGEL